MSEENLKNFNCVNCTLTKHLEFPEDGPIFNILNPESGVPIFSLDDTIISEMDLTYFKGSIRTQPEFFDQAFMGLFGLSIENTDSYLADGTYALINSETSQSQHPFFIYKDQDDTRKGDHFPWRGFYSNNLNPQEWTITNNKSTGQIDLEMKSIQGLCDLFLFYGDSLHVDVEPTERQVKGPNKVIKAFQNITMKPFDPPRWSLGWHIGRERFHELKDEPTKNPGSHLSDYYS